MKSCRLCGERVELRLSLNPTPVANSFPDKPNSGELYPLDLMQCVSCQHVQIGYVVPDAELYGQTYKYETPSIQSLSLVRQAQKLKNKYPDAHTVLEIGSNNGLNLAALSGQFLGVMGIDPSGHGANVLKAPFDAKIARKIGKRDLIVANNVFAHIADLDDVFRGIDACLTEDGVLVFEVQYLIDMADKGLFDMVYHEHRDYHTLTPLVPFLAKHNLAIKEVERIPNHGGSIRVYCGRGDGISIVEKTVDWDGFQNKVANATYDCIKQINEATSQIIAFGATAKACTLIHQFGIQDKISYCVDSTLEKQGRYIAGTGIKIMPENVLHQSKSDKTLLLTAWNYEDIIRPRYPDFDFVVPFRKQQKLAA